MNIQVFRAMGGLFQYHSGTISRKIDWADITGTNKFQFLSGTISSKYVSGFRDPFTPFQFHTGTISRLPGKTQYSTLTSFNSTLV